MKKILLSVFALVLTAICIDAKTIEEARIYLNPGHGSWGPNDRPMATIPYPALPDMGGRPDTCGFYESNTNLWKVLKLGTTLESLGAKKENIMYSRVKNGPFPYVKGAENESMYNRSLTEICEEVEANNMDYFLSVHSNAATEGTSTNYPLYLYRGLDGKGNDYQAGSYDMAEISWSFLHSNKIDPMTAYSTSSNLRGDVSFYGSSSDRTDPVTGQTYSGYLGVLKHGCPGFLSEGYFHTYQPARHRALNPDYCRQEGVRYARGIAKYFGSNGETTGYIMGFVKDLHQKIENKLFTYGVGTDDQWLPLNGATVELYKDGTKINEYTVDNNYNGVFVFEKLAPGEYTLDYKCDDYKEAGEEYKLPVTVKANETTYVKAFLESQSYIPPAPPTIIWENYPDPEQDGDIHVGSQYNMKAEYQNSALTVLADKTIRRSILHNDSLFVLAIDANKAPHLYIINPKDQQVLKTLDTSGTQGGILALSDIAFTADGVLCAGNMEETQFTPAGTFRVYRWDDYSKAPVEWFTSQKSGNYFNANTGNTLAITGDSKNCRIITTSVTTGTSRAIRVLIFNIEDGVKVTDIRNQDTPYTAIEWGEDFKFTVSPRSKDNIIVDGSATTPIEYKLSAADASPMTLVGKWENANLTAKANDANFFKYAKRSLMAAPTMNEGGENTGIKLFDITDGVDKSKTIATEGVSIDNEAVTYAMGSATVENADINLYLVKNTATASSITKFTTKDIEQPTTIAVYAYGLDVISTESNHTFNFTANSEVSTGNIIFTDAVTGEEKGKIAIDNIIKGANSFTIAKTEIPFAENKLNWAIELQGDAIARTKQVNSNNQEFQFIRLNGVTIDNSPESNYFGRIYAMSKTEGATDNRTVGVGLYAFNADWSAINTNAFTGGIPFSSPYRISTDATGRIFSSEWSDPNSGVYMFNPADFTCLNLFREGIRNGSGLFIKDGVQLGGSTTSTYILGEGENTMLYTYDEDYTASGLGKGNNVLCYNIGTDDKIVAAPSKVFAVSSLTPNTNCEVVPNQEGGMWISQTRYNGNNTPAVPSLFYINSEGTVKFNSGDVADDLNGSAGSGFAVSKDNKTLVINNGSSELVFFDITWTEGVPTLSFKYKLKHTIGEGSNSQIHQLAFDYAGNLFAAGKYLGIFTVANDMNSSITPAKKSLAIDAGSYEIVAPTEASAVVNGNNTVTLSWTAPASEHFESYNLYLNDVVAGTATKDDVSYEFTMPSLAGEYKFGVTAIYPNGEESTQASATISVSGVETTEYDTINVYPNPTTGMVNIKSSEEIVSVKVFSATGALVGDFNENVIDLSNLSNGTYYIKVNNMKVVPVIKR